MVTRLPDGSAFDTFSMPLPADHWLTAKGHNTPPMPFRMGGDDPRRANIADMIRDAARYAIRASTMNGQETDFDPDAMVQNFIVGLLGYHSPDGLCHDDDCPDFDPDLVPPHRLGRYRTLSDGDLAGRLRLLARKNPGCAADLCRRAARAIDLLDGTVGQSAFLVDELRANAPIKPGFEDQARLRGTFGAAADHIAALCVAPRRIATEECRRFLHAEAEAAGLSDDDLPF